MDDIANTSKNVLCSFRLCSSQLDRWNAKRFLALDIYTSITGKDKSLLEKLHSVLAQLEYKNQIDTRSNKGVQFKGHLYVPEIHQKQKQNSISTKMMAAYLRYKP